MGRGSSKTSYDILIVGGGVLGITIAFWLSELYDVDIAIIDKESKIPIHTTSRNTGVVHRPFYLDPEKRGFMARIANRSYIMWKKLVTYFNLPWKTTGIIEVATDYRDLKVLRKYLIWARSNGMSDDELEILDHRDVRKLEPEVDCVEALYSRLDASTHFGILARKIYELSARNGVKLISRCDVDKILANDDLKVVCRSGEMFSGKLLINSAGCGSLKLARSLDIATEFSELYFRGDYWVVDRVFGEKISRNIYSVPKRRDFPFLDPHLVVRYNGEREIGPSATPVASGYAYYFPYNTISDLVKVFLDPPVVPKLKIMANRSFISLARDEWRSTLSRKHMVRRMKRFLPNIEEKYLISRGTAGVRCQLIDGKGLVLNPKILIYDRSIHILNYNSPGATGAPAFSAVIVDILYRKGYLDSFKPREKYRYSYIWSFEEALKDISSVAQLLYR